MKRGDLPREYHFFQGYDYVRVPERVLIAGRVSKANQDMSMQEALAVLRARAAQYKRPFNIETQYIRYLDNTARIIAGVIEVRLAARSTFTGGMGGPYRLERRNRVGRGHKTLHHDSAEALLATFEKHLMRWQVGEKDAL